MVFSEVLVFFFSENGSNWSWFTSHCYHPIPINPWTNTFVNNQSLFLLFIYKTQSPPFVLHSPSWKLLICCSSSYTKNFSNQSLHRLNLEYKWCPWPEYSETQSNKKSSRCWLWSHNCHPPIWLESWDPSMILVAGFFYRIRKNYINYKYRLLRARSKIGLDRGGFEGIFPKPKTFSKTHSWMDRRRSWPGLLSLALLLLEISCLKKERFLIGRRTNVTSDKELVCKLLNIFFSVDSVHRSSLC